MPPMLNSQRHLFSIPDEITYLNCSFLGPQLNASTKAGHKAIKLKQNPWQIMPADFFTTVDRLRQLSATLLETQPENIALVPSTSYGMAIAAKNLPIEKGQSIALLAEEFPSNVYCWQELAQHTGAKTKTIARPFDGNWTEQVINNLDANVAIAALSHCHWTDGGLLDLKKIGEVCRQKGIALAVDLTQSLGVMPFSVKEIQPDFIVASSYKWLLGPYGLGLLYAAPHRQQGSPLEYNWITRKDSRNFSNFTQYKTEYTSGASRYDMGERSQFIHVPMLCAALEQILSWEVPQIYATLKNYNQQLAQSLQPLGIETIDSQYRAGHLLGLKLPQKVDGMALTAFLREKNIYVSMPGKAIRVSPHLYNNKEDQERLFKALEVGLKN